MKTVLKAHLCLFPSYSGTENCSWCCVHLWFPSDVSQQITAEALPACSSGIASSLSPLRWDDILLPSSIISFLSPQTWLARTPFYTHKHTRTQASSEITTNGKLKWACHLSQFHVLQFNQVWLSDTGTLIGARAVDLLLKTQLSSSPPPLSN